MVTARPPFVEPLQLPSYVPPPARALWLIRTGIPLIVRVASRELPVVFEATVYDRSLVPVRDGATIVSHEASLLAVHGQSPCVVTRIVRSPPHQVIDLLVYASE